MSQFNLRKKDLSLEIELGKYLNLLNEVKFKFRKKYNYILKKLYFL